MYTVDISPSAWNQLAHLTVETYRRIREELDAVAATLPDAKVKREANPSSVPSVPSVVVDDAIALYTVDHSRRRVLLVEVARRLPREP